MNFPKEHYFYINKKLYILNTFAFLIYPTFLIFQFFLLKKSNIHVKNVEYNYKILEISKWGCPKDVGSKKY